MGKKSTKLRIALVDHEKQKVERIAKKIGEQDYGKINTRKLTEVCEMIPITLNIKNATRERLLEMVIERLRPNTSAEFPDIVFVDINLGPPSSTGEDRAANRGINLALDLRRALSDTPVGLYTGFHLSSLDKVRISMMSFAAILENITDLAEGQEEVMLTGDQWLEIFEEILKIAREQASQLPSFLSFSGGPEPLWTVENPRTRSLGFLRAAPKLVANTLAHLPDKPKIEMTQLSGGFSGSFLVRADVSGGDAAFVVKIDEDPSKLSKELEGYQIIESRVRQAYYLPVSGSYRLEPFKLSDNWWGAFAMAYEFDAKPLIEQRLSGIELCELYRALWAECLFSLYGQTQSMTIAIGEILPQGFGETANKGWHSLARYREKYTLIDPEGIDSVNELMEQLRRIEGAGFLNRPLSVPWVEHVHGDLNCRNILYDRDKSQFRVLDFPHVGPPNCLAIDFVKAEAELLLIMLDWSSGNDCDFERVRAWKDLTTLLTSDFVPLSSNFKDAELDRTFEAVSEIRKSYRDRSNGLGEVELSYRLYLLSRVMKYLNYSDLTIAKRYLAFVWAAQMSSVLETTGYLT